MKLGFVTLFPEIIHSSVSMSILGRAQTNGIVTFATSNPRDFTYDRHHKVDDSPYGGEAGMLLKAEPVALAIESLPFFPSAKIVFCEPHGRVFEQEDAVNLSSEESLIFACGHYEGLDARLEEYYNPLVFSIGHFIVTGGELPALIIADAIVRLLPGVLGNSNSLLSDSFSEFNNGLISAPNYTRPEIWRDIPVPPQVLSGNHELIQNFRTEQSRLRTKNLLKDQERHTN